MDPELLVTLKALSDASRLRIVGLLAARPYAVEELAASLGLTPGTVVHHLKRLREAGLVEATPSRPFVLYSLRLDRLQAVGRMLDELERTTEEPDRAPGPDGRDLPAYDAKVLRAFVVDGRLASIPAQPKKREPVLDWLMVRCFAEDRPYPEREVNELIGAVHPDTASLRRYLVETGRMTRAGGVYRRTA
jgi:DNA-binding HxlR family transcriptional regulator